MIATRLQLGDSAAAALLASFAAGRFSFTVPGGTLEGRFGLRIVALAASGSASLAAFLATQLTIYRVLLGAQFVLGVASALFTTAALASLSRSVSQHELARALAFFQGSILFIVSFSPAFGGLAASHFGLVGPFWLCLAAAVLALLVSYFFPQRSRPLVDPSSPRVSNPRRRPSWFSILTQNHAFLMSLLVGFAAAFFVSGVRNTLVPLDSAKDLGLSESAIGGS